MGERGEGRGGRGPEPGRGPGVTTSRTLPHPGLAASSGEGKRVSLGLVWVLLAFYLFIIFNLLLFFLDYINIYIYIDILLWVGGE